MTENAGGRGSANDATVRTTDNTGDGQRDAAALKRVAEEKARVHAAEVAAAEAAVAKAQDRVTAARDALAEARRVRKES